MDSRYPFCKGIAKQNRLLQVQDFQGKLSGMSIKLVALDLDGTIVNNKLEISPRTVQTIQYLLKETDVRVVIATGRMYRSTLQFAETLGIQDPIISYQGALIRDYLGTRKVRHHATIPLPIAQKSLQFLLDEKYHVNVYVTGKNEADEPEDHLYTNGTDQYASYYAGISGVTPIIRENLMETLTAPPTKFLIIDDHRIDHLLKSLQERFQQEINICKSRYNFCEMIDLSASKWNALHTLGQQWGIQTEEIMAIGDHGNDYSMISQAGMGVAMGQAPDDIKSVARYVTGTIEEDGAATAIERFVINNEPLPKRESAPLESV